MKKTLLALAFATSLALSGCNKNTEIFKGEGYSAKFKNSLIGENYKKINYN